MRGNLDMLCLRFDVAHGCDTDNSLSGFFIRSFRLSTFHEHSARYSYIIGEVLVRLRVSNRIFLLYIIARAFPLSLIFLGLLVRCHGESYLSAGRVKFLQIYVQHNASFLGQTLL